MNRKQWFTFAIGFFIIGSYLLWTSNMNGYCSAILLNDAQMTACFVRRYAYAVPGLIFGFLAWLFLICGWCENSKQ